MAKAELRWGIETNVEPLRLTRMEYQAPGLGFFPLLAGRVRHLITWGPDAQNMSARIGPDREHAIERTQHAMARVGMVGLNRTMIIVPVDQRETQILEITASMFEGRRRGSSNIETQANFIYTTNQNVALAVKAADCTVSIMHTTLPDGKPLAALLHGGRDQLDIRLAYQAIERLIALGCKPEDILVGVTPSIDAANYYVQVENSDLLRGFDGWKERGRLRENESEGRIYLDTLGYLTDQLIEAGVTIDHIQPYGIDTLSAAEQGEGFSQRRATYTGNPNNNGRFLVAAQLY